MALPTFIRVTLPLAAMNFTNQASRSVVATVGPLMAVELALSASGLGALAAVFFAAYALAQLPIGAALDLCGARRVQAVLALVSALGFLLCALAPGSTLLGVGRFITGIGIAGALIAIIQSNRQWYRPDQLAQRTGAAVFIGAAGGLAATVPVQLVLPYVGWRGAFGMLAVLACVAAAWIWLSVPARSPGAAPAPRRSFRAEMAEYRRIFIHPEFVRCVPAMVLPSSLVFTYQGLWAGPWLRDVGGLADLTRAQVLLAYALGMMTGNLASGQLASMAQRRGLDGMLVPYAGMSAMAVLQTVLLMQPQGAWALGLLWFLFAFAGSGGPASYSLIAQRYPPALAGRAATAINACMLLLVFFLQNAIGWVLDLWPRTANGGWDPAGYSWALGMTLLGQGLAVLWMLARRKG